MNSNISPTGSDPVESLSQAVNRVMREAQDWKRIMSLEANAAITVYLDMKSPHAYIAVRPTLELARDFKVRLDFRPYTLSYTGMGISKSLENNERRRPRLRPIDGLECSTKQLANTLHFRGYLSGVLTDFWMQAWLTEHFCLVKNRCSRSLL